MDEFVEKPDAQRAAQYLASGEYRWNAGMFVCRASVLLDLLAMNHPELAAGARQIAADPRVLDSLWPELTKIAIDHAVATIACCFERPEPWARDVYKLGLVPRASLPACGILQVSDTERFTRAKPLPLISRDALRDPEAAYLKRSLSGEVELADPLLVMERAARADRPLPPHFLPCGTKDPLLDDTRRMAAAVTRLGGESILRVYPGEIHAFHALVWRPAARRCWIDLQASWCSVLLPKCTSFPIVSPGGAELLH